MRISKQKLEGERPPKGYGVAWIDFDCATWTCYPIPFNWLARAVREAYFRIRFPRKRTLTEKIAIEVFVKNESRVLKRLKDINLTQKRADAWVRMCKEFDMDPDFEAK